jgi:hypothetical protein
MKYPVVISLILASIGTIMSTTSNAEAQCFGDAAQAFGCKVQATSSSGELQHFGDSSGSRVLPDYGNQGDFSADNLFTLQERRQMYRRIITNPSGDQNSKNTVAAAVGSSTRPLRPKTSVGSSFLGRYRPGGSIY